MITVKHNLKTDVQGEYAILRCVIDAPAIIQRIEVSGGQELFGMIDTKRVFIACSDAIRKSGGSFDLSSFCTVCAAAGISPVVVQAVIGCAYMMSMWENYLASLVECYLNRRVSEEFFTVSKDFEKLTSEQKVLQITKLASTAQRFYKVDGVKSIGEAGVTELKRVESLLSGSFNAGFKFCWPGIDDAVGMLRPGGTYLIGGAPKMGKSVYLLNAIIGYCKSQSGNPSAKKILLYSAESKAEDVYRRLIAIMLQLPEDALYSNPQIYSDYRDGIKHCMDEIEKWPLLVFSMISVDVSRLRALCMIEALNGTLGCVCVDHFGRVELDASDARNHRTEKEKYQKVGLELQSIAEDCDLPVVVIMHTVKDSWDNRGGDMKEPPSPSMTWFSDYGALSKNCSWALIVQRDHVYCRQSDPGLANVVVVFSRHSRTGKKIQLECLIEFGYFGSVKKDSRQSGW